MNGGRLDDALTQPLLGSGEDGSDAVDRNVQLGADFLVAAAFEVAESFHRDTSLVPSGESEN